MSASTTRTAVQRQLVAFGCQRFDLGALSHDGYMMPAENYSAKLVLSALRWLRRENARGAHIFIRPAGNSRLSLLDDLTAEAIVEMKRAGFEPAIVVETSPDNFQAWLNHCPVLDDQTSSCAAKELARRFHGDPSSADWRHFGRLAGFTNEKPHRRLLNGLQPLITLRESSGIVYTAAKNFPDEIAELAQRDHAALTPRTSSIRIPKDAPLKAPCAFHNDPRYAADLHRADLAWAIYAASHGLTEQQIKDEILYARDLSKKGQPRRQVAHAERTARKAVTLVQAAR